MKTNIKRISKSTLAVIMAICMLFSCLMVGTITTSAATIPANTIIYFDASNATSAFSSVYMSVVSSSNQNYTATNSNTSGAGSYVPKNDTAWYKMSNVTGNIYRAVVSSSSSIGKVSFWSVDESNYDNVWSVNCTLGQTFNGTSNYFTVGSTNTTHGDRQAKCYGGSWSSKNVVFSPPTGIVEENNLMIYLHSYNGSNIGLSNGTGYLTGTLIDNSSDNYGYINITSAQKSSYTRITNNLNSWTGDTVSAIASAKGGEMYIGKGTNNREQSATPADTTITTSSITTTDTTISVTTSFSNVNASYKIKQSSSMLANQLVYQYYIDNNLVSTKEVAATTSSASSSLSISGLSTGSHTLKTVLTDGNIYYVGDTDTFTITAAATPLATPTNVKIDNNTTSSTVTAAPSLKSTLTWSSVSNASSYTIYKDGSSVATGVTGTSYSIDRKYSNRGSYTVAAVSNSSSYSDSDKSSAVTLNVNKTQLSAPTVTVSKDDIASGGSVTLTATDTNSGKDTSQYTLRYNTSSNVTTSSTAFTNGTATVKPTSTTTYYAAAVPVNGDSNDYYTTSTTNSAKVNVYSAGYKIGGTFVNTGYSYSAAAEFTDYMGNGIFTYTVENLSQGTYYFKLYNGNEESGKGWTYQDGNTTVEIGEDHQYTFTVQSTMGSFQVTGSGTYVIYYDSVNNKIWITQNTWKVTASAYTQDYDLSKDAYGNPAPSTTGGTVDKTTDNVEKGKSTTFKASAKAGYDFAGWYTDTACTKPASGSYTSATYTFTPSANTDLYALFKKTEPTRYQISVGSVANATVTITYNGKTYKETESVSIPVGAEVTVTVTPDSGYYVVSTTPALTNGKFTVSGNTTVTVTLGTNSKITTTTNNAKWGTVTADPTYAHKGDKVTITIKESEGTFASISGKYSDGKAVTISGSGNTRTFTMEYDLDVTITVTFKEYEAESEYYYNGYGSNGSALTGYHSQQMTEAKLDGVPFSYYHVVGRNDDNYKQRFTVSKGKVSAGSTVSGRWFYVETPNIWDWTQKDPQILWEGESTYLTLQYVGFKGNNKLWKTPIKSGKSCVVSNGDSSNFKQTYDIYTETVQFGAIWITSSMSNGKYEYNWYSDNDRDNLDNAGYTPSSGSGSDNGKEYLCKENDQSIYSSDGKTGGFYDWDNTFATPDRDANQMTFASYSGNYYIIVLYPGKTYTINDVTVKVSSTTEPKVLWMPQLPNSEEEYVKTLDIYAKNGALRETKYNRFTELADTEIVSITDPDGNDISANITKNREGWNSNYDIATNVPIGSKITFKTKLSPKGTECFRGTTLFKNTHYVKGFVINGMTYEIYKPNDTGVYEMTWTVEDINTEGTTGNRTIEITPVYYLKDNSQTKTFYIEGYAGQVESEWGNTPYAYPYYTEISDKNNAFGGYAGQPMLFWGGKYQMEVPLTHTGLSTGKAIKGITLSNGYFDMLHRQIDGVCREKGHRQTYDYDDFVKIYREKGDSAKTIYFWFKYRTKYDNFGEGGDDRSNYDPASKNNEKSFNITQLKDIVNSRNGLEIMTDYYGNHVGMFSIPIIEANKVKFTNTKLTASDLTATNFNGKELLVISTGYKNTYMGDYGTMWAVYSQSNGGGNFNNFIGYIPSSMLFLNNLTNLSTRYTNGGSTAAGQLSYKPFLDTYTELQKNYKGRPVLISYEREILNSTDDVANRCDGRWLFSDGEAEISANIEIQYADSKTAPAIDNVGGTDGWKTDPFTGTGTGGEKNIGDFTKSSAYFTNTSPVNLFGKTLAENIIVDDSKDFTFRVQTGAGWKFVGWVRYNKTSGEYSEITSNINGSSNISANDTYIARFIRPLEGSLIINHTVRQDSSKNYTGTGSQELTVRILDGTTEIKPYNTVNDGTDIDVSAYIKERYSNYTIEITVKTEPDDDCTVMERTVNDGKDSKYLGTQTPASPGLKQTVVNKVTLTVADILADKNLTALRYKTYLKKEEYSYKYQVKYTFPSRFFGKQSFTISGDINDDENVSGSKDNAKLTKDFIEDNRPYQRNFLQNIKWQDYPDIVQKSTPQGNNTYLITATVDADSTPDDEMKAEINLPYVYVTDTLDDDGNVTEYSNKAAVPLPIFASADAKTSTGESDVAFDEDSSETFTITTPFGHLFEYNLKTKQNQAQEGDSTDKYDLIEAAPYVLKDVEYHYTTERQTVERTGQYKKPDGTLLGIGDSYKNPENGNVYTQVNEDVYTVERDVKVVDGIIQGTGTKKYFTRWDIYTADSEYVASSYHSKLNYCAYEDYYITPVYNSDDPSDNGYRDGAVSTTISYLGNSRNQWNERGSGNYAEVTKHPDLKAGDKLYTDFAIAYEFYNDTEINKIAPETAKIEYGIVVENIGFLDGLDANGKIPGKTVDANAGTYAELYSDTFATNKLSDYIKIKLGYESGKAQKPTPETKSAQFIKIGGNQNGDAKALSPMNRIEYYNTFTKSQTDSYGKEIVANQHYYAYRVSSYICVNGEVKLSDPEYFTLYNIANR